MLSAYSDMFVVFRAVTAQREALKKEIDDLTTRIRYADQVCYTRQTSTLELARTRAVCIGVLRDWDRDTRLCSSWS